MCSLYSNHAESTNTMNEDKNLKELTPHDKIKLAIQIIDEIEEILKNNNQDLSDNLESTRLHLYNSSITAVGCYGANHVSQKRH